MTTTTALRAEDLLALPYPPDGAGYELSEGELITVSSAKYRHEDVKATINQFLVIWAVQSRQGKIYGETLFRLGEHTARQPDVAYVSHARRAGFPVENTLVPFVPDLAVEVISESEHAADAESKVHQYLNGGVAEVWQVYPEERVVHIRTAQGIRELRAGDVVESPVLPGFSVAVADFFA